MERPKNGAVLDDYEALYTRAKAMMVERNESLCIGLKTVLTYEDAAANAAACSVVCLRNLLNSRSYA